MEDTIYITLYDEDQNEALFRVEAEVEIEDELYAVLQQVQTMDGIEYEDIGDPLAFRIDDPDSDEPILTPVEDEDLLDAIEEALEELDELEQE
jgi:uncharacterized protein YrzB (UPF0473 family)